MAEQDTAGVEVVRSHSFKEEDLERLRGGWVTWPTKPMRPFDEKKCVALAVKARHYQYDNSPSYWCDASVFRDGWNQTDGLLSREEAIFWFDLCISSKFLYDDYNAPEVTEAWIRQQVGHFTTDSKPEDFLKAMTDNAVFDDYYGNKQVLARLLRELVPYDQALAFIGSSVQSTYYIGQWVVELGPPPEDMRDAAMEKMRELFDGFDYTQVWLNGQFAQMLTMLPYQPAIEGALEYHTSCKRDWDSDSLKMAYKLDDDEKLVGYLKKLKRSSWTRPTDDDIKAFFAHFEYEHLDILFKKVIYNYRKRSDFRNVLKTALEIKAPEVVEVLYDYLRSSNLKTAVEEYVLTGESYAIEGLLRLCHSRSKKRDWALSMMRQIVEKDNDKAQEFMSYAKALHPKSIAELVEKEFFAGEEEVKIRASIDYLDASEFTDVMKKLTEITWPSNKAPEWLRVESLPPVYVLDAEKAVPLEVISGAIAAAKWVHSSSKAVKKASQKTKTGESGWHKNGETWIQAFFGECTNTSTEHLILEVIRAWDATQDPKDGDWVLPLAGLRGGVSVTAALDHYIREARDSTARYKHRDDAKLAIHILAELDTPEARHDLLWQTKHLQDDSLRSYAKTTLDGYKTENKLDDDEFADLAVPTFDMERSGARIFDFGTRQIKMVVRGRHDISFVDEHTHKVFKRFPPQRKSDDADKYSACRDQYAHISEPLRQVFDEQNARFERAMMVGRQWKTERWHEFVGQHPVLGHIARRLLWKIEDKKGGLVAVVLPDATGSFMNLDFDEVEPAKDNFLSLVHPCELTAEERDDWVEQLADFEVIQPFDQLERPIYSKDDVEALFEDVDGQMDEYYMIEALHLGWDAVKTSYGSCSAVQLESPRDKKPVMVRFSGHLDYRYDGRVQKSSWSYLYFSSIDVGDKKVFSKGDKALKNAGKISDVAFSEAVYLVKQAIAHKK